MCKRQREDTVKNNREREEKGVPEDSMSTLKKKVGADSSPAFIINSEPSLGALQESIGT